VDEEKFKVTRLLQDGVIRQIEIIGEAVRHISKDIRDRLQMFFLCEEAQIVERV
jgi:uncharacterized protein with HEPN domain